MFEENNKSKRAKRVKNNKAKSKNLNARIEKDKPPKNWKHMYLRSEKLKRAQQLGIDYPKRSTLQMLNDLNI